MITFTVAEKLAWLLPIVNKDITPEVDIRRCKIAWQLFHGKDGREAVDAAMQPDAPILQPKE